MASLHKEKNLLEKLKNQGENIPALIKQLQQKKIKKMLLVY